MLMGSAAQPRSGTAPKAPAANAVFRNLRRLRRFARIPPATTDPWASLFMPSSPDSDPAKPSALLLVADRSPPKNCLQYSFQYYHRNRRFRPGESRVVPARERGIDGRKVTQASQGQAGEVA